MTMFEFYPQIKLVHVAAVVLSGSLFLLRGLAVQFGIAIAQAAPVRYLTYAIDTVLLTAALMLATIMPKGYFANGWLATKIILLVVYIVLGTIALKRGKTRTTRALAYLAALLVFAFMITVARAHHPLGIFA